MKKTHTVKPVVEILIKKTYLAMIYNSLGSRLFRNYYALVNGTEEEVLHDGDRSCAVYVSSILVLLKLSQKVQLTVHLTIEDMMFSGWEITNELQPGCILIWKEKMYGEGNPRRHIGFYLGNGLAVSNDGDKGYPILHDYRTYKGRGIERMFWHSKLEE